MRSADGGVGWRLLFFPRSYDQVQKFEGGREKKAASYSLEETMHLVSLSGIGWVRNSLGLHPLQATNQMIIA